ncbi:MAG: DUF1501 domain-containing protein [Fimbriimonas sp.]|nr:DUF1501 domain-containing protein [Fimbriimonas sp.]
MSNTLSRREILKNGGMIAVGLVAPRWLSSIAEADVLRQAKGGKPASDTILVVCQWSGGNDGLNTVVPYANKAYYSLRPMIGIQEPKVLKLNSEMGLNPGLSGLADLFQQGKVAIIQNVGYPQPNRSHFKSMEIWQSASPESTMKYGWLGRHFDAEMKHHPLNPVVALGLSTEQPLALAGENASIPCFASLADLRNMIGDADSEKMLREIQGMDAPNGTATRAVQNASRSALDAVSILQKQLATYKSQSTYANDAFGNGFKQIAQLIATSPQTRVVYFQAGGFDTHARQVEGHQKLLTGFGNAVNTFQKEMEAIGKADKVVTLVFSEFGRRAQENASLGTDHGAAAPMFLIGSKVKGGFHGPNPDLDNLFQGDVKYTQDFREVYAATLDTWMGGDSETVLGQRFSPVDVFAV